MEFVRNMERRRLIKPQDILATLQSIPEDESESELQEHVFDSDSDEDFIPQNISSESEDSEGTNPEDIPSTSTGDRAHAVMLPRDHPPGRGQKKSAKRPRNERTTDNDGGEGNATTNTREGESEGILVSADGIQWKPVEIGEHLPGRRASQNILREAPDPTGYARRNIIIDNLTYLDQPNSFGVPGWAGQQKTHEYLKPGTCSLRQWNTQTTSREAMEVRNNPEYLHQSPDGQVLHIRLETDSPFQVLLTTAIPVKLEKPTYHIIN
ncbi:uncharacterized protein [Dendrobates tinctorius]|uniref:uncharacterized protein n=1 Tax=Dendrobates tinctorius TaxID=92724 RepID=UPI003CC9F382